MVGLLAGAALLLAGAAALPSTPVTPQTDTLDPSTGYAEDAIVEARGLCCGNGIALDPEDPSTLFVNHAALDRIDRIDVETGEVQAVADETDRDDQEIVTPDDIWIDPKTGDKYVTEILVNGVRKIAPDGTRTRVTTGIGDGAAHPNAVTGIHEEGELRLFISMVNFDPEAKTGIWEVDPDGVVPPRPVYGAVGGQTVYGQGLRAPNAFEFGPDGEELFVPESYGGRVLAVDVDAHTARTVYEPETSGPQDIRPNGIAVRFAQDGSLLYAEQDTGRLLRLDPSADAATQEPEVVAQLSPGIDGIAPHPDGRIFTSNFRRGGIAEIGPDGEVSHLYDRGLNLPNGHARLDDGRVAVGDLGSLSVVEPDTGEITRPKEFIRDDFDITIGTATTGGCDVYATGFFRGTLQHVDVCNPEKPHTEILPRRTFVAAWDMVPDGDSLWVTDSDGTVWHVTGVDGAAQADARPFSGGFQTPTGIAIAGDQLYVAESDGDRVTVLDKATGRPTETIAGLDEPEGLAVDPCDGSLLVVEAGAGNLTRIHTNGTRSTVATGLATDIRGVDAVPVLNYFADVSVGDQGDILVTTPEDGAMTRLTPTSPPAC